MLKDNMKISIIVPVYNEEKFVIKLLNLVNEQKKISNLEIIVVDDNSTDETATHLKENPSLYDKIIFKEKNEGKGSAIISGLDQVTGEYVLIQDSDLEYSPSDYARLFEPIKYGADVVYGSRFMGSEPKRVLYYTHRVANQILTTLANIFTNFNFTDIETGYKLIKTSVFKNLNLKEKSFGIEIELTMKLSKIDLKFYEVGISYFGRTYAEGKKIGIKDGLVAIYKIFYYKLFN
tara:strand:+ start:1459 stop:2160 length:702 start_codon:yes stop_codon:yes gene_type:complete